MVPPDRSSLPPASIVNFTVSAIYTELRQFMRIFAEKLEYVAKTAVPFQGPFSVEESEETE